MIALKKNPHIKHRIKLHLAVSIPKMRNNPKIRIRFVRGQADWKTARSPLQPFKLDRAVDFFSCVFKAASLDYHALGFQFVHCTLDSPPGQVCEVH